MKFRELASAVFFITAVSIGVLIIVANYFYEEYYPDDNFVEEAVEKQIEQKTGVDIDLTPESIEKKKN